MPPVRTIYNPQQPGSRTATIDAAWIRTDNRQGILALRTASDRDSKPASHLCRDGDTCLADMAGTPLHHRVAAFCGTAAQYIGRGFGVTLAHLPTANRVMLGAYAEAKGRAEVADFYAVIRASHETPAADITTVLDHELMHLMSYRSAVIGNVLQRTGVMSGRSWEALNEILTEVIASGVRNLMEQGGVSTFHHAEPQRLREHCLAILDAAGVSTYAKLVPVLHKFVHGLAQYYSIQPTEILCAFVRSYFAGSNTIYALLRDALPDDAFADVAILAGMPGSSVLKEVVDAIDEALPSNIRS